MLRHNLVVIYLGLGPEKCRYMVVLKMSYLVSWFQTGQQCNSMSQIYIISGKAPNFKDLNLDFFCYNTKKI